MVFGLFASVADELHLCLFVQARLRHAFCPSTAVFILVYLYLSTCLYLSFHGFEGAVSAPCGRVANVPFWACLSSDLGGGLFASVADELHFCLCPG